MGNYIFNICSLIAAFASFAVGRHLWRSFEKTKIPRFKKFSFAFFSVFLAFLILSFPKLILIDPSLVQFAFILVDLSFLVSSFFFISALLSFFEKFSQVKKNIPWAFLFLFLVYIVLNIFFFIPATPLFSDGQLSFYKNGNFWLHSLLWMSMTLTAGALGIFFLSKIRETREKKLFWKTFFIGLGSALIALAGILFWYFKFFNPLPQILNISGVIGDFGFIFGIIGISFFRFPREIYVKKISR